MDIEKLLNSCQPSNEDKIEYLKDVARSMTHEELLKFVFKTLDCILEISKEYKIHER